MAGDNPEAAARFGNALIDRVAILEDFPLLGSLYPKRPGVRKLVSRPDIIFYRFREQENSVDILRYWRGSQREPNLRLLDGFSNLNFLMARPAKIVNRKCHADLRICLSEVPADFQLPLEAD